MVHIASLNFENDQTFAKRIFAMKNRGTDLLNYAESAGKKMPGHPLEFNF